MPVESSPPSSNFTQSALCVGHRSLGMIVFLVAEESKRKYMGPMVGVGR
jgi:hypothetical protein